MTEALAWISLAVGITTSAIFLIVGLIILRNRTRTHNEEIRESLARIDEASDAALSEINRISRLALDEIDEKYQAMLFLYNLLDEKKKEIELLSEAVKTQRAPKRQASKTFDPVVKKTRNINGNARYANMREMYQNGLSVQEIAKKMRVGQGEVKLVLDIGKR